MLHEFGDLEHCNLNIVGVELVMVGVVVRCIDHMVVMVVVQIDTSVVGVCWMVLSVLVVGVWWWLCSGGGEWCREG